jgi:predicted ATPase
VVACPTAGGITRARRLVAQARLVPSRAMLTELRIQNFKAWRDTGSIRLAPLTFLFGTNSSGKSSLHQFLLMLRQTVESPDRRRVLHTGDAATPVDLGGYIELVNGHDARRPLSFDLGWRLPEPLRVEDTKSDQVSAGDRMSFAARVEATDTSPPRMHVSSFRYRLSDGSDDALVLGLRREREGAYKVAAEGFQPVMTLGRKWPVSAPSHFHGFPDDLQTRFQNLEFAADLTLALDEQLAALAYLGPLRERPSRLYRWSGEEPEDVGWRGERTVAALLAGQERTYNLKPRRKLRRLQVLVAEWLQRLGVIDDFRVVPIGRGHDVYEVRVRAPGRRHEVLLTDVGFGVSQVLPVITECFYAPPGSTLILEQPEIHLHPAVQAGLADLFIEAAAMREDNAPRELQMIVESHSEHLVRRLLRRIADESLRVEDVAMYFVRPGRSGSVIEPLEVDDHGNVRNWPADFFGDQTTDMLEQTRHARRRRREEAGG